MNLQDSFLNQARMQKIPVNVYLMNGYQLKGLITGFDPFIVLLDAGGKQNIVYKHAISTITPQKPVTFFRGEEQDDVVKAEKPEGSDEQDQ